MYLKFFRVSFRVSLEFLYGFLRVSCRGSYQDFSRVSCCFSEGVSLGLHLAYKMKKKETVKTGSREAEEQEVEQQKHMTEEKKK